MKKKLKNNLPLVSIIVPVYNTAKYLPQCIESLFSQTYKRIEFIFVNDASTDNSLDILNNYARINKKLNIRIIDLVENAGLANARNVGRKSAKGQYLSFCDSDDWVEPTMIESCVNMAIKTNADITTFPFYINNKAAIKFPNKSIIGNVNKMPNDTIHYSLCNKLFKASLINDNEFWAFKGVDCWEDLIVTAKAYTVAENIAVIDTPLYHYRKEHQKSLTGQQHKKILKDHLIYTDALEMWFSAQGEDFYLKHQMFLKQLRFTTKIKMLRGKPIELHRWKYTYPCTSKEIMSYTNISLPYRIAFALLNLLPI
mgnify:FL=1